MPISFIICIKKNEEEQRANGGLAVLGHQF